MHTNRSKARRLLLAPAAAACLVAIAGCTTPRSTAPTKSDAPAAPSLPAPIAELIQAGEREARHPSTAATTAPPPDGIDAALGMPLTGDATKARQGLAQTLADISKPASNPPPPDIDPERRDEALHHYIQGRQMLLAGEPARAAAELRIATDLDPSAGEPWRELGEAQLAQGLTGEAISSFRASVATGLREPRTLELLGRSALERADHAEATRFLAAALEAQPDKADPALARLILVELSRALAPQGYIVAAKEAIERALTSPAQLSASTRYSAELGAIFRRQGELWRDVGDAMCRLGKYPDAVAAYEHSAELPTVDGKPILPRIVFAWMRAGRPSSAAASVLEAIALDRGSIDQSSVVLLRYITQHGGDSSRIADALDALKSAGPGSAFPSVQRALTLAQAAILSTQDAVPVLRRHVESHPSDVRASVLLLNSLSSPEAAAAEAGRLASHEPKAAKTVAEALLQSRFDLPLLLEALKGRDLILAYLSAKQGRFGEALAIVQQISEPSTTSLFAQAEIATVLGDPEVVNRVIGQLKTSPDPDAPRALAHCHILAQHYRAALETLRPLLDDPSNPDRISDLTTAGDMAVRLNRADEAEQWINQAAQLDPFDDRPASLLLVLYSSGGPRADVAKLTRIVRELRQNIPDSRTLRLVRARETMRRAQWAQTESELRQLCQEDPDDQSSMELLAATWTERIKADPATADSARTWLDSMLARRPQSAVLLSGSATLDIARGRALDAVAPLKAALAAGAGPDVSRRLERLLREPLGKMTEADDLTRARLARRPLNFADSIEAAGFKQSSKLAEEAIGTLHSALTPEIDLTREQVATLLTLVGRCVNEVKDPRNTVAMSAAVSLFDRLVALHPEMPVELHLRRLDAMTCSLDTGAAAMIGAVKLCVDQHPSLQARPYVLVSNRLRGLGRATVANEFIVKAVAAAPSDADLFEEWFLVVFACGTADDARPMIEAINNSGKLRTVLDRISQRAGVLSRISDTSDLKAEAAYLLGTFFSSARKTVQAEAAYELALTYDPKHPWASNDLGYALADRGIDIARASQLLEQAAANPKLREEASVIDSLAWLRYKQGIILDENDPQTGLVKRRGALSLLENAVLLPRGQMDFTILDHAGDARWLAGQKDAAILAWRAARALCEDTLKQANLLQARPQAPDEQGPPEPVEDNANIAEARTLDASTKAKIDAATRGDTVHVAPQLANPDPQPAPPSKNPDN